VFFFYGKTFVIFSAKTNWQAFGSFCFSAEILSKFSFLWGKIHQISYITKLEGIFFFFFKTP
jgi:hypothetical protein